MKISLITTHKHNIWACTVHKGWYGHVHENIKISQISKYRINFKLTKYQNIIGYKERKLVLLCEYQNIKCFNQNYHKYQNITNIKISHEFQTDQLSKYHWLQRENSCIAMWISKISIISSVSTKIFINGLGQAVTEGQHHCTAHHSPIYIRVLIQWKILYYVIW